MDMDVVRFAGTNMVGQTDEPRPEPPAMWKMFTQSEPIVANVLPDSVAPADKQKRSLVDKMAGLQADQVIRKMENSQDRSPEELEKAVDKARRDAQGMRTAMNEPAVGDFPRLNPVIKPSDIKKSVEEDKKFFGSTSGSRNLLPVQGGRVGTNWDAQLRRMG